MYDVATTPGVAEHTVGADEPAVSLVVTFTAPAPAQTSSSAASAAGDVPSTTSAVYPFHPRVNLPSTTSAARHTRRVTSGGGAAVADTVAASGLGVTPGVATDSARPRGATYGDAVCAKVIAHDTRPTARWRTAVTRVTGGSAASAAATSSPVAVTDSGLVVMSPLSVSVKVPARVQVAAGVPAGGTHASVTTVVSGPGAASAANTVAVPAGPPAIESKLAAGSHCTTYRPIAAPPSCAGGAHVTVRLVSEAGVAVTMRGGSGEVGNTSTLAGDVGTVSEARPVRSTTDTRAAYEAPYARPATFTRCSTVTVGSTTPPGDTLARSTLTRCRRAGGAARQAKLMLQRWPYPTATRGATATPHTDGRRSSSAAMTASAARAGRARVVSSLYSGKPSRTPPSGSGGTSPPRPPAPSS